MYSRGSSAGSTILVIREQKAGDYVPELGLGCRPGTKQAFFVPDFPTSPDRPEAEGSGDVPQ